MCSESSNGFEIIQAEEKSLLDVKHIDIKTNSYQKFHDIDFRFTNDITIPLKSLRNLN